MALILAIIHMNKKRVNVRGDKAVDDANHNAKSMTKFDQEKYNEIYRNLATLRHFSPDSKKLQADPPLKNGMYF